MHPSSTGWRREKLNAYFTCWRRRRSSGWCVHLASRFLIWNLVFLKTDFSIKNGSVIGSQFYLGRQHIDLFIGWLLQVVVMTKYAFNTPPQCPVEGEIVACLNSQTTPLLFILFIWLIGRTKCGARLLCKSVLHLGQRSLTQSSRPWKNGRLGLGDPEPKNQFRVRRAVGTSQYASPHRNEGILHCCSLFVWVWGSVLFFK